METPAPVLFGILVLCKSAGACIWVVSAQMGDSSGWIHVPHQVYFSHCRTTSCAAASNISWVHPCGMPSILWPVHFQNTNYNGYYAEWSRTWTALEIPLQWTNFINSQQRVYEMDEDRVKMSVSYDHVGVADSLFEVVFQLQRVTYHDGLSLSPLLYSGLNSGSSTKWV